MQEDVCKELQRLLKEESTTIPNLAGTSRIRTGDSGLDPAALLQVDDEPPEELATHTIRTHAARKSMKQKDRATGK